MDLPTLIDALAANPGAVLAWDLDLADPTLSVYAVGDGGGVRQLAYASIDPAERKRTRSELDELGYSQGSYDVDAGVVWRRSADAFDVWAKHGAGLHAGPADITIGDVTLARTAPLEVVGFVDADRVRRGVAIRVAGVDHVVALHRYLRPSFDWSYGELDAASDTLWVALLGQELSDFLGVELVDG